MARSRNIKPGFFENDLLGELDPLARLFFIGLWTVSDYKGDVEYRPNKLKAKILPYDNCNIEEIVINLDKSGFITTYNVNDILYIHINNFLKHQNPHPNEKQKGSDIPKFTVDTAQTIDFKELAINNDNSRKIIDDSITDHASSLIPYPDSCNPHPDSLNPDSRSRIPSKTIVELKHDDAESIFKYWQSELNHPRAAFDDKRKALIKKHLKHYSVDDLKKAIYGCSVTPHNMGDNDRGERYDSIELILRDAAHIDRFMKNADNPPAGKVQTIEKFKHDSKAQADRIRNYLGDSL